MGTMMIVPPLRDVPGGLLRKILGLLSAFTLACTVPQVIDVWTHDASGVSLISWVAYLVAACVWFVHGVRMRDRSMYLACIGWIVLDAAVVVGIVVRSSG